MTWFEQAIRDHEARHGPSGEAWNISSILNCLNTAASGMETRRAETERLGAKHDSPPGRPNDPIAIVKEPKI